jgi:hypothetical protein
MKSRHPPGDPEIVADLGKERSDGEPDKKR